MRIGLFTDTYPPFINGVSTSVYTLAKELIKNNHSVFIITTNATKNSLELEENVLKIPGLLLKKLYNYRAAPFFSSKAMKLIKQMHLDIIHVHTEMGIGLFGKIVAKVLKVPLVYTYHTMYEDYTHYVNKGHFDYLSKGIVSKLTKLLADTSSEIISPSLKTKDALRRYGVDKFVNIVPTGISLEKFDEKQFSKEEVLELRKSYGIREDEVVFLVLGRIAKEKSIDIIIDGYNEFIKQESRPSKLVIVGDGPDRLSLQNQVASYNINDRVVFTGFVKLDEVPKFYRLGDIFCAASISETQGLTFIEAMAAGLVVLARYDKNLDNTLIDTVTGHYFTDCSNFVLKAKLLLARNETEIASMHEAVISQANKFSSDQFYINILEVYKRAIRSKW
jgi:1,2-diacylglycerol 3-alpha-glucosyltransferase